MHTTNLPSRWKMFLVKYLHSAFEHYNRQVTLDWVISVNSFVSNGMFSQWLRKKQNQINVNIYLPEWFSGLLWKFSKYFFLQIMRWKYCQIKLLLTDIFDKTNLSLTSFFSESVLQCCYPSKQAAIRRMLKPSKAKINGMKKTKAYSCERRFRPRQYNQQSWKV